MPGPEATQAQVSAELGTSSEAHLGRFSDCHCPTSTAGQDAASAESQESLPTLMPNGPFLLTSTDGPALGQSQGPLKPAACRRPSDARPRPRPARQVAPRVPGTRPGFTYQRSAGTLCRHMTGNGTWKTLREKEKERLQR